MENFNPILNELKEISPFVAAIGNKPTYTVPQGYFDAFALQLVLRIAIEEKSGVDPVLNINKDNVYQVPQGYFENLPVQILQKVILAENDPALSINKDNVYEAPIGYFEDLADTIMNRIKAQEIENPKEELEILSPLLGQIGKKNPFAAPEGYFNDVSDNVVAGVKAIDFVNEELENLSPVMLALKDKQVYEAPAGYFETSAAAILEKAKQQQPAKIISIGFSKKIMRYAAAAVVAGVIAVSGYFYSGNKPSTTVQSSMGTEMAKVSDADIENFINNNTVSIPGTDSTLVTDGDISVNDSKDLLANISDEELQQYAKDQHIENPITN